MSIKAPLISPHLTRSDWLALLLLSVIWGGAFVLIEYAIDGLPPLTMAAARVALAAVVLYIVLRLRGQRMPRGSAVIRAYLIGGTLGVSIPFALIAWGQTHVTAGLASILNAMVPIWGVVIAHFATDDERLTPSRGLGVLIGFVGVVLVIGPDALGQFSGNDAINRWRVLGQAAIVLAALGYASGSIYSRIFKRMGVDPLPTSIGNLAVAAITLLPIAAVVEQPWALGPVPVSAIAATVTLALVCTAFAFILFFRVLASAGATNTQLVTYLIPVSAIGLGALLRGEQLAVLDGLGMVVIALGLAVLDGRPWGWIRARVVPAVR